MSELVANMIAGAALVFSAWTWWVDRRRGKRNEIRQRELDAAQSAIKERQLLFDEQMLAFAREVRQRADIRVTMTNTHVVDPIYVLELRNVGKGPAFGVYINIEGVVDRSGGWNDSDLKRVVMTVPQMPIERLDPESQPFVIRFATEWPGFKNPVSLTVRWRDSGSEQEQHKRIQVTPDDWR
jgi:hypothetical protein